ncbi:MAG: hypothetical protein ACYDBT_09825 [Desulfobulbaceae bacterium]
MNLTKHAQKRKQQRGLSDLILKIIEYNGKVLPSPGGAERIFFGKKECNKIIEELKKTMRLVERAKGGSIIIADGKILTIYKS